MITGRTQRVSFVGVGLCASAKAINIVAINAACRDIRSATVRIKTVRCAMNPFHLAHIAANTVVMFASKRRNGKDPIRILSIGAKKISHCANALNVAGSIKIKKMGAVFIAQMIAGEMR